MQQDQDASSLHDDRAVAPSASSQHTVSPVPASIPSAAQAKSLDDVKSDMSALYEALLAGAVDVKLASELANITGKYLKAEQLKLAREIFGANQTMKVIGHAS